MAEGEYFYIDNCVPCTSGNCCYKLGETVNIPFNIKVRPTISVYNPSGTLIFERGFSFDRGIFYWTIRPEEFEVGTWRITTQSLTESYEVTFEIVEEGTGECVTPSCYFILS